MTPAHSLYKQTCLTKGDHNTCWLQLPWTEVCLYDVIDQDETICLPCSGRDDEEEYLSHMKLRRDQQ